MDEGVLKDILERFLNAMELQAAISRNQEKRILKLERKLAMISARKRVK